MPRGEDEKGKACLRDVQGSHEEHGSKHCQVTVYTISRCPCVCKAVLMTHTPYKDNTMPTQSHIVGQCTQ